VTDLRTAAAGAVATRQLARSGARTVAVLGTGTQGYLQVLALRAVRPVDTVLIRARLLRVTVVAAAGPLPSCGSAATRTGRIRPALGQSARR
jgi:ornithine cyclodeaminase/alanine dehydrogenase-like protein (mu-crystallin family)